MSIRRQRQAQTPNKHGRMSVTTTVTERQYEQLTRIAAKYDCSLASLIAGELERCIEDEASYLRHTDVPLVKEQSK